MAAENGVDPAVDLAATVAAETISTGQSAKRITEYEMENGVVLRIKPVPPLVLRNAARGIVDPEVPMVHIESKGRDEPNPDDPAFIAALAEARERRSQAASIAALLVGTEVKSIPPGIPGPDDDSWVEDLRTVYDVAGIKWDIDTTPGSKARYLAWLRNYAIGSDTELYILNRVLTVGVALTNAEVQAAAESFRSLVARSTNLADTNTPTPDYGDAVRSGDSGDG